MPSHENTARPLEQISLPKTPDLRIAPPPSHEDLGRQNARVKERITNLHDRFAEPSMHVNESQDGLEYNSVEELSQDLLEDDVEELPSIMVEEDAFAQTPQEQFIEANFEYGQAQEALERLATERALWEGNEEAGSRVLAQNAEEAVGWNLMMRASERRVLALSQEMQANDRQQEASSLEKMRAQQKQERAIQTREALNVLNKELEKATQDINGQQILQSPTAQKLSELMLASGNQQAEITRLKQAGTVSGWRRALSWVGASAETRTNEATLARTLEEQKNTQREMKEVFQTMSEENKIMEPLFQRQDEIKEQIRRLQEEV